MSTVAQEPEQTVAPPRRLRDYVVGLGPGIVVSMAWLGAGDLVDSSVSGGNYGYALMWSLALALFCRFFFVNAIAKYGLCNASGDPSLMAGFRRLWSKLPLVFALPAFPDALTLTVAGSSIGVLLAPFIMGGTIVLTTAKRFMQPGYANRWWETVILLGVFGVGVWASYGVVRGLVELALKTM